jgi:hypothetical protein
MFSTVSAYLFSHIYVIYPPTGNDIAVQHFFTIKHNVASGKTTQNILIIQRGRNDERASYSVMHKGTQHDKYKMYNKMINHH